MRPRPPALALAAALVGSLVTVPAVAAAPPDTGPRISEVRIDQPGGDVDEYLEVEAPAGTDLAGLSAVVIGDSSAASGVVESVVDLTGTVGASGTHVVAEPSFTLGSADQVATLGFENGDNVTHLLVRDFAGSNGDDLDADDDGTLDTTPWSDVVDALGLVATATGGDPFYGAALGFTDLGPDGAFVPAHAYRDGGGDWTIGAFDPDGGDDTPGSLPDGDQPAPECDAPELTPISAVQGPGATSPLAGSPPWTAGDPVTVRGVVTLAAASLGGYFLQEEPADHDGDPMTSEGIFVDGALPSGAAVGDTLEVTGGALEDFDRTQLEPDEVAVCDVAPTAIAPTPLTLPAEVDAREALEAMLVETSQDLQVTALYTAYEFGELGVALGGPLTQPTSLFDPDSPEAQALLEEQADRLLYIDDRDEFGDDNTPWFDDVRRRAGDVVEAGVVGTLFYSFGDFLLEPVGAFPSITHVEQRPDAPRLAAGNDLASFNVLNYFNDLDGRGARTEEQLALQTTKIVDAITRLDPAVLGLVELENDYEDHYDGDPTTVPAVQDLVDALNERVGEDRWAWVVPDADDLVAEGLGTDEIAVGIIHQPARATEVGDAATFDIDAELTELQELDGEVNESFSDGNKNRWPLAQSFEVDGQVVTVVVNHLKSKGSSCAFVDGPAFDPGDDVETGLTGNCDLTRTYAARHLVEWVETKPTGVTSPDTFVVGDLNAYEEEAPIQVFLEAGYGDAIARHGGDAATYKFEGRYGRLDHALASPSAKRLVEDAAVWRVNSPEPYGYLYYLDPVDDTAYASSDHDPVVVAIDPPGRRRGHGR